MHPRSRSECAFGEFVAHHEDLVSWLKLRDLGFGPRETFVLLEQEAKRLRAIRERRHRREDISHLAVPNDRANAISNRPRGELPGTIRLGRELESHKRGAALVFTMGPL